ncbi:DUF262 domain-containing protein [Methanobrevibacter sp.]|uniref:GmrSD restriction endonuclease domain-containing protein n=1 Tax=Methanobrevibacter sp. TaxID=66852 RepID=UPI003869F52D
MRAGNTTLNEFLTRQIKMNIPIYQRKYNWSLDECKQLFEDILSIGKDETRKSYFIGSIVVKKDSEELLDPLAEVTLIDGQQRITTLTLIYCALCNYYKNIDERLCRNIYGNYLVNHDLDETNKLHLTKNDNESLKYIINSIPTDKEFKLTPDNSINIYNNYEFFRNQINEENVETVIKGLKKLIFISVVLDQEDNPQLIFESLNSTGLELNKNDLIRNYILMGLDTKHQNELYENYWYEIEQEFKNNEWFFDEFIRYYLSFESGRLPKRADVYKEFKNHANSFENIDDLVKDVHKFAGYFSCIRFGKEEDPELRDAFDSLAELDFNVTLPFLLSAYDDYQNSIDNPDINLTRDEFIRIVKYVESYCLRRSICDIPTNSMNKTFARLSKEINKQDYYNYFVAAMFEKDTYKRFPTNEEVQEKLLNQNMYSKRKILNHVLISIENAEGKEFVSAENSTIEHIMPQNLTKDWERELGSNYEEIHGIYLHTLGNLTLTPYNSELGDKSFFDKKTCDNGFCKSKLTLNEGLCELDRWTDKEIMGRTKQLSKKIINIWKYPVKTSRVSDILNHINETGDIEEYTLDDFEELNNRTITRQLFDTLNILILKLDSSVDQVINKQYITYKKNKNFVEIIPLKTGLRLLLDIPLNELNDIRDSCEDVSNKGRWGTGLTRAYLKDEQDVNYIMDLIKQSYEYNL